MVTKHVMNQAIFGDFVWIHRPTFLTQNTVHNRTTADFLKNRYWNIKNVFFRWISSPQPAQLLHRFGYSRYLYRLQESPHLSTFLRASKVVSETRIFIFALSTSHWCRNSIPPIGGHRQHGTSKRSLWFSEKVGHFDMVSLVQRILTAPLYNY